MNFKKTLLFLPLIYSTSLLAQSSGQNYTISPYSNIGIGEILNQNLIQAGTQSQTWTGAYSYSLLNPATVSSIKYTTFDFGVNYRRGLIENGAEKQSFNGGSLSYLALAFQSYKKDFRYKDSSKGTLKIKKIPFAWNTYITLNPSTSVGYNYTFESSNPIKTQAAHTGKGGINILELGNGIKIGKYVSLGYSIGNLFGQISDKSIFSVPDSTTFGYVEDDKIIDIRGWQHKLGAMFHYDSDSMYHRLGLSYQWYSGMRAQEERLTRSLAFDGASLIVADTVTSNASGYKKFKMPFSLGAGYYFQYRRSFGIGIDVRRQYWGKFDAFFQPGIKFATRTDFGATFTLNPADEKAPSEKKMKPPIRIGARFSNTQNIIQSNTGTKEVVQEKGAFIGFGIPFTRRYFNNDLIRSVINIQVDYLQRGKLIPGLAKEQYLILTVGFNLGDIWFQHRKLQ